jgi:hypothetical protein
MPYLAACAKEGMRMFPVVSIMGRWGRGPSLSSRVRFQEMLPALLRCDLRAGCGLPPAYTLKC